VDIRTAVISIRTAVIVALALVFGVCAALGVNILRTAAPAAGVETVPVVVAAVDIPRFTTVTADLLKTRECPTGFVPDGAYRRVEDVIDRVAQTTFFAGEQVLEAKLSAKGAGRGMAAAIPMGMRAVSIKTPNVEAGVAGFILPGNKVDVLLTMKDTGMGGMDSLTGLSNTTTGGGTTTTLLQYVEVLAVDQRIEAPTANKVDPKELRSVTLLVTPEQAAKLDLGQNLGTLHLSLRNPQDKQATRTPVATLADLRFFQGKPWDERLKSVFEAAAKAAAARKPEKEVPAALVAKEPPPPPPAPPKVRTLRGTIPGEVTIQ
jgi:pilus assembly protein CpaB